MTGTRPMRRLRRHLTVENLWLYILSLIRKKMEVYAYALPEEIEKRYSFKPSRVMMYIVLHMLEDEGLITSKMKERRKYYRLTKKGNEALKESRKMLTSLSRKL